MKSFSAISVLVILALSGNHAAQAQAAKHGYAAILVHPVAPAAAAAAVAPPAPSPAIAAAVASPPVAAVSPALAQYQLSDEMRLALDAARADADVKRAVIERQRVRGALDEEQFRAQMDQYQSAVQAYDQLAGAASEVASDEQAEVLKSRLWDFNRSDNFKSMLAEVSVRRGEDGSVLAERASLEDQVRNSIATMRASLPADRDTRPMQAYLDALQDTTLQNIRARSGASDTLPMADVVGVVQPVQQAQVQMISGGPPDLNIRLNLNTTPNTAIVILFTKSGYSRNFVAHSTPTVMRGLLQYMVIKPGFKTVSGTNLDVMNAVTGEFNCQLVARNSPDPPLPCHVE